MIFENGDRIVFAGDSVTDMGSANPVGEGLFDNLGQGYVRRIDNLLAAVYPEIQVRVTNSGIGGNTSRDLLQRFQRDVVDLNPDWVSICIGINDVWRQFDTPAMPDYRVLPEEYKANLESMILSLKGRVKGIFILSPYYMEPNETDRMRARMDDYTAICRELSEKHGCIFVDLQAVFSQYCTIRHSSFLAWDRIHPNQVGATLIARAFLDKCDFNYHHVVRKMR